MATFDLKLLTGACREGQAVVEEAFMPTLRTLLQAPATSPLAEVNVSNVAEILVQLTDVRHLMVNKDKDVLTDIVCSPSIHHTYKKRSGLA